MGIIHEIKNWRDLSRYGIEALTGEACAYSYRLLCDLTSKGVEIVQDCYGLVNDKSLAESWNAGSPMAPHRKSIMLSRFSLTDLAVFALIREEKVRLIVILSCDGRDDQVLGIDDDADGKGAEMLEVWARVGHGIRRIFKKNVPTEGSRCVHQMSQRVV